MQDGKDRYRQCLKTFCDSPKKKEPYFFKTLGRLKNQKQVQFSLRIAVLLNNWLLTYARENPLKYIDL